MYSLVQSDENTPVESVEDLKQKVEDGGQIAGRKAIRRALREWFRLFPHAEDLADSLGSGDPDVIRNDICQVGNFFSIANGPKTGGGEGFQTPNRFSFRVFFLVRFDKLLDDGDA